MLLSGFLEFPVLLAVSRVSRAFIVKAEKRTKSAHAAVDVGGIKVS